MTFRYIRMDTLDTKQQIFLTAIFSALTTFTVFMLQGRVGLILSDEGFLWYGAQRVLLGEIPIRDFMAYDLGRYYWTAAIMSIISNNGIIAVKIAVYIFAAIGLFIGMMIIARSKQGDLINVAVACALIMLWCIFQHKSFDITTSIVLVAILTFLIQKPTANRFFLTGIVVGFSAIIGRNHGVYGVVVCIGIFTYIAICEQMGPIILSMILWWAAGVVIGYLPMLVALALVPGLADAFWKSILFLFECKCTNIGIPIPWPWIKPTSLYSVVFGLFFIVPPLYGVIFILNSFRKRYQGKSVLPLALASAFLSLPYAHYTLSRADIQHLSFGIYPFIIGVLSISSTMTNKARIAVVALLIGASMVVAWPRQPGVMASREKWQIASVGQDQLRVNPRTARELALFDSLVAKYSPTSGTFLTVPRFPGAYAVFQRKAPIWEIYPLFPRDTVFQEEEIQRIEAANPAFAVVSDHRLSGREELRFTNSHRVIANYIRENFDAVVESGADANLVYKKRETR